MGLLARIWVNTLEKPYHFLMPRIRIRKRIYGLPYVINLNDHLFFLNYKREKEVAKILSRKWGKVWDVGCNFGLFSILSASKDNEVVSFDLSRLALSYLQQSAALNKVSIQTVDRPLTVKPVRFSRVKDAKCTNRVTFSENGEEWSIPFTEAAEKYGTPDLIKMDIEGGEKSFLEHPPFLDWLTENRVSLLVELHDMFHPAANILPEHEQLRVEELDEITGSWHALYQIQ